MTISTIISLSQQFGDNANDILAARRVTGTFANTATRTFLVPRSWRRIKQARLRLGRSPKTGSGATRDETVENVRAIKLSYPGIPLIHLDNAGGIEIEQYTHAHVCVRICVPTWDNLDPNIRLTFCDGDCISLLFHTSPFLRGNRPRFPLLGERIS